MRLNAPEDEWDMLSKMRVEGIQWWLIGTTGIHNIFNQEPLSPLVAPDLAQFLPAFGSSAA